MDNEQFLSMCMDITSARRAWASSPELRAQFHNNLDEFIGYRTAPARGVAVGLPQPALAHLADLHHTQPGGSFA